MNNNGKKAIQLAASNDRHVRSTSFPHEVIHKDTWISPDGKTVNQIDHIIVDNTSYSSVIDVRSYREAALDSYLLIAKLRERCRMGNKKRATKTKET